MSITMLGYMILNTAKKPCKPDLYFKDAVKKRLPFAMRTDQPKETRCRETLTWQVQVTTMHPLFKIKTLKLWLSGVLKAYNWAPKVLQHNKSRPAVSRSSKCITRMDWMQYHQISERGGIKSLCSVWWKTSKWRSFSHRVQKHEPRLSWSCFEELEGTKLQAQATKDWKIWGNQRICIKVWHSFGNRDTGQVY